MVIETSGNPAFQVLSEDSFSFCLSPRLQISCNGATTNAILVAFEDTETFFTVEVNGEHVIQAGNSEIPIDNDGGLQGWFMDNSMNAYCYYLSNDVYNLLHFENDTQEPVRVEIRIADGYPATFRENLDNPNPTVLLSEPEGLSQDDEQLYRKASFCLASLPLPLIETLYIYKDGNDLKLFSYSDNESSVTLTYPDGTSEIFNIPVGENSYDILNQEGIYEVQGNVLNRLTNYYYKNSSTTIEPTVPSIINTQRDNNNAIIEGSAQTYTVVTVIPDDGFDEPIAYYPVSAGDTNFIFNLPLEENFSGYIRCQDGIYNSAGAEFNI